jgi:hypothetical protein
MGRWVIGILSRANDKLPDTVMQFFQHLSEF